MERAERFGLGASAAGHIALLAALSLGLFAAKNKLPIESKPLDVMFVDEVAEQAAAPTPSQEAPAPSEAPEVGAPEEAPPPAAATPAPPEPTPAPPQPASAPAPTPTPKAAPQKPAPSPKPASQKPAPPAAKAAPAKPAPAKPAPARERLGSDFLKGLRTEKPSQAQAARGSRLGPDFLKGVAGSRAGTAATPPAAISGAAAASLAAAIREQLARYWVPPSGPIGGLRTSLRVHLNRDGSIAGRPEVIGQDGVNDSNRAYARQHADAAVRTVFKAAPLKLPPKLYEYWKLLEPLNFDATLDR